MMGGITAKLKPDQWARLACKQGGYSYAYRIAKKCAAEFIGSAKAEPNPVRDYWQQVVTWIEKNAPPGELDEKQN